MEAGLWKAIVAALALPPAGPLLLAFVGLLMLRAGRAFGTVIGTIGLGLLWLLSCHAVSIELAKVLLPRVDPVGLVELRRARVEAVVVLGGGLLPEAAEYGVPQPAANTLQRLRYGVRLARVAGLPLAFSGGAGWSGRGTATEAEAARLVARQDFGFDIRWVEGLSRDTRENADRTAALLHRDRIRRIALVTDSWHLPRAVREFQRAGFEVLPAPTGQPVPTSGPIFEWLPSGEGLLASRRVLREWLALQVQRWSA
ncbi:MAG: YdcF family protein [Pseudomonadota bacterium]